MSRNLISRRKAINAVYGMARPTGIDELPYEYAEDVINNLPSADIMEYAREIKDYCEGFPNCEGCRFFKDLRCVFVSLPQGWDLTEGESE